MLPITSRDRDALKLLQVILLKRSFRASECETHGVIFKAGAFCTWKDRVTQSWSVVDYRVTGESLLVARSCARFISRVLCSCRYCVANNAVEQFTLHLSSAEKQFIRSLLQEIPSARFHSVPIQNSE
jgi:hypothetical protein